MAATQHRQIPAQPAYIGNMTRAGTPPPSDTGSNMSSPPPKLSRVSSPTPSSSSSSSGKSVTWGENDSDEQMRIGPGQYSMYSPDSPPVSPKRPPKPVLRIREIKAPNMPPKSAPDTPISLASKALDSILISVVSLIKSFKASRELDFANTGCGMMLAKTEKNKPFISQLRDLDGLRTKLAAIPTQGNALLEDKHNLAGAAIALALERMKEHQLKLYENFTKAVEEALTAIAIDLSTWVNHFEYPSKLDFPANSENGMVLLNTEQNQPFINQLRQLVWFRDHLNNIPVHDNEQLQEKRRAISEALEGAFGRMEKHQVKLYRHRHTRRY